MDKFHPFDRFLYFRAKRIEKDKNPDRLAKAAKELAEIFKHRYGENAEAELAAYLLDSIAKPFRPGCLPRLTRDDADYLESWDWTVRNRVGKKQAKASKANS
jgi:hypothetical protein